MTVEFTAKGPLSQGLLTYSQSVSAPSPHYADQTRLYSQKGWDDLRLNWADVVKGTAETKVLKGD